MTGKCTAWYSKGQAPNLAYPKPFSSRTCNTQTQPLESHQFDRIRQTLDAHILAFMGIEFMGIASVSLICSEFERLESFQALLQMDI